jgi:hypothetical protein
VPGTGCDRVDDEFVRHMGFPSGEGNLYKAVSHDANLYLTRDSGNRPKGSLRAGYEKVEGSQADWSDLESLVRVLGGGSDAQVATGGMPKVIDEEEFMDWLILVSYSLSDDSGGKNSYLCESHTRARKAMMCSSFSLLRVCALVQMCLYDGFR